MITKKINKRLVGEFYHQTTKLSCLLFILLSSCSSKKDIQAPWGTLLKTISGVIQ